MDAVGLRGRTLRWGILLGVLAIVLVVAGPLIIANIGSAGQVEDAPAALAVTMGYSVLTLVVPLLSAVLIGAALVMRHAEALVSTERNARLQVPSD